MTLPDDLVYFVRAGDHNEELRYSLRSVAANLPHARVWIIGYTPKWVTNVTSVKGNRKATKWQNVADNLRIICEEVDAESFVVMNDDFFITRPIKDLPPLRRHETLQTQIDKMVGRGSWRESLLATLKVLRASGIRDPLSYELHAPVVMEREKLAVVVKMIQSVNTTALPQWRTMYGNVWGVQARPARDWKKKRKARPATDLPFESSEENSFADFLEERLRALFPKPCIYERQAQRGVTIAAVGGHRGEGMTIFRSTLYPALMAHIYGQKFKFVGGRLKVKDSDLEKVRDYVARHPEFRITEEVTEPVEIQAPEVPGQAPQPTNAELRKELADLGLPTNGNKAELKARLDALGVPNLPLDPGESA